MSSPKRPANKATSAPTVGVDTYEAILEQLKPALTAAMATLESHLGHASGDSTQSEVPHEDSPGFFATTDGGWQAVHSVLITDLDDSVGCRELAPEIQAKVSKHNAYIDEIALEDLKRRDEGEVWEMVLEALGKDESYAPSGFTEVSNALYEAESELPDSEDLYQDFYCEAESANNEAVDFRLTALLFSPENRRNELKNGCWEVRLFGEVQFGEPYWTGSQPETDHAKAPETQIAVDPNNFNAKDLAEQMKKGVTKITNWMRGLHAPPPPSSVDDIDLDVNPHFRVVNYFGVGPVCTLPRIALAVDVTQEQLQDLSRELASRSAPFTVEDEYLKAQGFTGNIHAHWADLKEESAVLTFSGLTVTLKGEVPEKPSQIEGMVVVSLTNAWKERQVGMLKDAAH